MGQVDEDPQTTSTEAVSPPVLTFDEDGDLHLEVGGGEVGCPQQQPQQKQTFVVCSRALARASKPLKAMLHGGFAESMPPQGGGGDAAWTVALPDDDPGAFAILMHIIHNRFAMVPVSVGRADLFKITVLTDKYDMTEVLRPWARTWVAPLVSSTSTEGVDQLLWIAWILGHKDLFVTKLKWLQDHCTLNQFNKICYPSGEALEESIYIQSLGIVGRLRVAVLALHLFLSSFFAFAHNGADDRHQIN